MSWKDNWCGFTCGTFDLFHAGHVLMLKEVRDQCLKLIVGLQTDPTIDRPTKNRPIQSITERHIQLAACKYVSEVWLYETEAQLYEFLQKNNKGIHKRFLGEDWKGKEFTGHDLPIPIVFNSRKHSYSSTELRERISSAEHMIMLKNTIDNL